MKKALAFLLGVVSLSFATAADVSTFVVQVSPTTTSINQAIDLTVKALDANGNIVKDYVGDIFLDITSTDPSISLDSQEYTLPSDGIYTFVPGDQGVKTFSKGLVVKKMGNFSVKASEIINEAIKGDATLVVKGGDAGLNLGTITISSPTAGSVETNKTVNVVGNSSLNNSPLQVYINGIKMKDDITSPNGDFSVYVSNVKPGENIIQLKIVDAQGSEVANSDQVKFTYQPADDVFGNGFEVLPGNTVKQGQKVTFIFHATGASSVQLALIPSDGSEGQKVPLDSSDNALWKKEYLMDKADVFTVNATMSVNGVSKSLEGVGSVKVLDAKSVQQVKYFVDNVDKTSLHLSWTYLGNYAKNEIPYFMIRLSQDKNLIATTTGAMVSGAAYLATGLDLTQQYFTQITPVDVAGRQVGDPSDVILIEPTKGSAPLCRVEGIDVLTKKIADKYYLSWAKVEGADRYIIYRSETPVDKNNGILGMQKVGETADSKFGYPYDPSAKKEAYAYYAVVAICSDGSALQIGGTQKVKVGPAQNLLFMLLISSLLFGLYKLNVVARKHS